MSNRLNYKQSLINLKPKENILIYFHPFNGEIRNKDGETIGTLSTRVCDKLINSELLKFISNGNGLLSHEKHYKLK
jgi:hypothetical protein